MILESLLKKKENTINFVAFFWLYFYEAGSFWGSLLLGEGFTSKSHKKLKNLEGEMRWRGRYVPNFTEVHVLLVTFCVLTEE